MTLQNKSFTHGTQLPINTNIAAFDWPCASIKNALIIIKLDTKLWQM